MKHFRIWFTILLVVLTIPIFLFASPLQAKSPATPGPVKQKTTLVDTAPRSDRNTTYGAKNIASTSFAAYAESNENMILVELCSQGLLDPEFLSVNEKFGALVDTEYPLVLEGFQAWAPVVAGWMRSSKKTTSIVNELTKPWAAQVAYIMGEKEQGNLLGKIEMYFSFIFSWIIGVMSTYFYIQIAWFLLVSFWMYLILRRILQALLVPVWNISRKKSLPEEKTPEVSSFIR